MCQKEAKRGSALVISIGLILLLAVFMTLALATTRSAYKTAHQNSLNLRARMLASSGMEKANQFLHYQLTHYPKSFEQYSASEGANRPWFYGRPVSPAGDTKPVHQPGIPLERAYWVSLPKPADYDPSELSEDEQELVKKHQNYKVVENGVAFRMHPRGGTPATVKIGNIGPHIPGNSNMEKSNKGEQHHGSSPYEFGYSGESPPSVPGGKNVYGLRIEGAASKIYINGPVKNDEEDQGNNLADSRITLLNNLGKILNNQTRDGKPLLSEENKDLGSLINTLRTKRKGNIDSIESLKSVSDHLTGSEVETLKNFLTPYAWVDQTTLNPDALKRARPHDPNLALTKKYTGKSVRDQTDGIDNTFLGINYAVERLATGKTDHGTNPDNNTSIESPEVIQPRAPVNVNTASEIVLQAVLMNIEARFLNRFSNAALMEDENDLGPLSPTAPTSTLGPGYTENQTVSVDQELAGLLAEKIVNQRNQLQKSTTNGFTHYEQLHQFIYALNDEDALDDVAKDDDLTSISPEQWSGDKNDPYSEQEILALQQAIIANINPNSRLTDLNPDFSRGLRFGDTCKADLTSWTTELSFSSNGYFRISSLGRVLGPKDPVSGRRNQLATAKLTSYQKLYETIRMTTQKQFQETLKDRENIQLYPENLKDIGGDEATHLDGYIKLATRDWMDPTSWGEDIHITYNEDFHPVGNVTAAQDMPVLKTPGPAKSSLLNDGAFLHTTRRYGGSGYPPGTDPPGGNDQFIGHSISNFSLKKGAISMWVKPTWFGPEFPGVNGARGAAKKGIRTVFSAGGGNRSSFSYHKLSGGADQLRGTGDRVTTFVRRYNQDIFMMGYRGFVTELQGASLGARSYYDQNYMPSIKKLQIRKNRDHPYIKDGSINPKNWFYPGRWHHIAFQWDQRRSMLFVDGVPDKKGRPKTLFRSTNSDWSAAWNLFVGSNRFQSRTSNQFPFPFNGTIDSVRIWHGNNPFPNREFTPPNRFESSGTISGIVDVERFLNREDHFRNRIRFPGQIMNVSWNISLPSSADCQLSLKNFQLQNNSFTGNSWAAKSLTELPSEYSLSNPSNGRGIPVVKSDRSKNKMNQGASIQEWDQLEYTFTLQSKGDWCTISPTFNSFTVRVARNVPKVKRRFFD